MDGILIINKEKNYTSNDVVKKVKKILNCNKVGHTGTLDPNATGVLPLLLGGATKISKYIINHDKEYEAILQLGTKTTTGDREGEEIDRKIVDKNKLNTETVKKALNSFLGKIKQFPPMYSAIKVNGKKLYQYARNGEKIEIEPRNIEIFDIKLLNINTNEEQIRFYVKCSKGTYIRTLCEDIAERLETVGYMKELKRLSVGEFTLEKSITISELEKNIDYSSNLISIEKFFMSKNKIDIQSESEFKKYLNGALIKKDNIADGIYRIYENNKFIGIGTVNGSMLKRDLVLK